MENHICAQAVMLMTKRNNVKPYLREAQHNYNCSPRVSVTVQSSRQKNTTILQTQLLYLTASNVLNQERLLKEVQYLLLINLSKLTTVYILAHH